MLREPDRARFVHVNRIRLRVWEWGDEHAPAIICAHGAQDHGRMWDGFAPQLADLGYRVLAPDMRGHGDSGRISSGHVWGASALDLALLARSSGPPVGFVGHSFGSGQLMWVAAVWPELVRWVVSLDGLGPPPAAFADRDLGEAVTSSLRAASRALGPPRVYASRDEMIERRRRANPRMPREWLEHLVRHGAREVEGGFAWKSDPKFSVGFPGDFSLEHLQAEHALLTRPVLALTGGEHDTWSELSPAELEQRMAHLPRARHQVIEGAGHYLHIEAPDAVLAEVRSFLDEVGP
ncbi:MAG: alpha/beta fold hydrolase [Acidimicrobiales bacterium]